MSATDKEQSQNMSFWGHLDVLRGTLFRIIITLVICAAALFAFMPTIFDQFIMGPARGSFVIYQLFDKIASAPGFSDLSNTNLDIELINIKLASQFFLHITTSLWMAAVIAFPVILWLLWSFVSPALYAHEKRGITRAFFFGCCMFYLGVAVGYFLVFPLTLQFLANYQLSSLVPNVISLDSYMDNFLMICLMMGILFELPLVAWLLGKTTLLNCILGFIENYTGTISFYGKKQSEFSRKELAQVVGLVPQLSQISFDYTVEEFVLMGCNPTMNYFSVPDKSMYSIVE